MTIERKTLVHLFEAAAGDPELFDALLEACEREAEDLLSGWPSTITGYSAALHTNPDTMPAESPACPRCQRSDAAIAGMIERFGKLDCVSKYDIGDEPSPAPDADPPHRIAPLNHKAVPGENVPPPAVVDELRAAWTELTGTDPLRQISDEFGAPDVNARYR